MNTDAIIRYYSNAEQNEINEFEEAFYDSLRQYSLRHLPFSEDILHENVVEAIRKSLQVCHLAGIDSGLHFKKIYVYDAEISAMHIDWRMSKKAVNLMVTQISALNEGTARWLWKLADF